MKWSIQVSWRLSGTGSFQSSEFSSWNESFIWSRSGSHHPTGSKNSAVRDSTPALVIRSSLKAERRPSAVVTSRSGAAFCPLIFFCKFMLEMLGLMKSCWVFQVSPRHPTVWPSLEEPSGGGWPERATNFSEKPPDPRTLSVCSICFSLASSESAPPATSSTYMSRVSRSKASGYSVFPSSASRFNATAAWFPVELTPYHALVMTQTSGLTVSLRDGSYKNKE